MATTPTTRVTALARRTRVDIDIATYPASNYQQLVGVQELKLVEELRTQDDEAYEDDGAMREAVTGYSWRLEVKLLHSTNAAGTSLDTVHAFLRAKFEAAKAGVAGGEIGTRWYDRNGVSGDPAKEGRAYVKSWSPEGGGGGAQDIISLVIQGQGPLAEITNPAADLTPVVSSLDPATGDELGGELIHVYGHNLTAATDVDFGANAATYEIINDGHIVAIAPAGTGTVAVRVTTAAGQSADTAADNYVYT